MINPLQTDIKYLKGVGPLRAKTLGEDLSVFTLRDLLYNFPYKYIDRSVIHKIKDLADGMPYVQLKGQVIAKNIEGSGRRERLVAIFADGTGYVRVLKRNCFLIIPTYYWVSQQPLMVELISLTQSWKMLMRLKSNRLRCNPIITPLRE